MIRIDKILLPTDFSPASRRALDLGLFLAEEHGAEIHLYHALVLHGDDPAEAGELGPLRDRLEEVMAETSRSRLADWIPQERQRHFEVRQVRERGFSAAPMILEYAEREEIDLVVMGTHGRRGAARMFLGSVAERVVRHADRPVLTVRESDAEEEFPGFGRILVPVDLSDHSPLAISYGKELAQLYDAALDLLHVVHVTTYPVFYGLKQAQELDQLKESAREALDQLMQTAPGPTVGWEAHVVDGPPDKAIEAFAEESGADLVLLPTQGLSGLERALMGSVAERVVRRVTCPVLTIPPFGRSLIAGERHPIR